MKSEPEKSAKAAADRVIAAIRGRLGEPLEGTIAALTRLGDAKFDPKTEARVIGELTDLDNDLFRTLFEPARHVRRLQNTLELFERRLAAGAS